MAVTVGQLLELLERLAPPALAEEWDNVGLLAGDREQEVTTVLCALDLNQAVLDEAVAHGAELIVTHHPILFRGRQRLTAEDSEGRLLLRLIRSGISLAAMHTNYDNAHPGVNDALAERLELSDVIPGPHGMCIGNVSEMPLAQLKEIVEGRLGGPVRSYGNPDRRIRHIAVMGGAGEDFAPEAAASGADVYVTGEMSYHKALDAIDAGLCVLEAGHAATENPAIYQLAGGLQNAANDVQYRVHVLCSAVGLFL